MALTKTPIELSSTPSIVDGGNATAITIDSSENVLVGKTALAIANEGVVFEKGGAAEFTTDAARVMRLNRTSSDGSVLEINKDGTTIGSWMSRAGLVSTIILDPRSGGMGLSGSGSRFTPTNEAGVESDARNDIGTSTYRFKDIYLSGGVNFSANANAGGMTSETLDDYEEGTFTLTWTGTGGTANSTNTQFKYVKVGSLVTVFGNTGSTLPNATGILTLTGLPFINRIETSGSILYRRLTPPSGAHTLVVYIGTNTSTVSPLWSSSGNYTGLDSSQINGNNLQDMYFSISYRTD